MNQPDAAERFVDRMGRRFELEGAPRTAGRIFALLLLSPTRLSLVELARQLAVSKGSVSTNARWLARIGLIERSSPPGERRDFYGVGEDLFARVLESRLDRLRETRDLLEDLRRITPRLDPSVRRRVADMNRAHDEMMQHIREALARRRADSAVPQPSDPTGGAR